MLCPCYSALFSNKSEASKLYKNCGQKFSYLALTIGCWSNYEFSGGEPKVNNVYERFVNFIYRRPMLCTLYGAVDFLNVLKKYILYL